MDASALVKRYVNEAGSEWLRGIADAEPIPLLFTSRMTIVEVISAFARRVREGALSSPDFIAARNAFRSDCLAHYQIMPPSPAVVDLACSLLGRYPLRAYDAVQLATALGARKFLTDSEYPSPTFLSADERLNDAARAEGLAIGNPDKH